MLNVNLTTDFGRSVIETPLEFTEALRRLVDHEMSPDWSERVVEIITHDPKAVEPWQMKVAAMGRAKDLLEAIEERMASLLQLHGELVEDHRRGFTDYGAVQSVNEDMNALMGFGDRLRVALLLIQAGVDVKLYVALEGE